MRIVAFLGIFAGAWKLAIVAGAVGVWFLRTSAGRAWIWKLARWARANPPRTTPAGHTPHAPRKFVNLTWRQLGMIVVAAIVLLTLARIVQIAM